jgi:hypothetical protein
VMRGARCNEKWSEALGHACMFVKLSGICKLGENGSEQFNAEGMWLMDCAVLDVGCIILLRASVMGIDV